MTDQSKCRKAVQQFVVQRGPVDHLIVWLRYAFPDFLSRFVPPICFPDLLSCSFDLPTIRVRDDQTLWFSLQMANRKFRRVIRPNCQSRCTSEPVRRSTRSKRWILGILWLKFVAGACYVLQLATCNLQTTAKQDADIWNVAANNLMECGPQKLLDIHAHKMRSVASDGNHSAIMPIIFGNYQTLNLI